ncbi:hypothetical protein [Halalkalicoccus paucihalophilus]|uniref:hypothetical protein n=1 Tax=Halalkalicoccus paucihalophilus TaxID=1008153 RepID=UPI001FE2061E|nr:hypothetical protein [Halalkalicoccus paucihalophilus]
MFGLTVSVGTAVGALRTVLFVFEVVALVWRVGTGVVCWLAGPEAGAAGHDDGDADQ